MSNWDAAYKSGEYLSHWDYRVPSQELVATVAALNFPAGSVALDIGCGAGREAIFLAQSGFRVYGVDFSQAAIRIAKRRATDAGVSVQWRRADVTRLPLPDQSVDFVNDRGCFHVIGENRRPSVAQELWRVMKPGARMLLRGSCRRGREGFVPVTKKTLAEFFKSPYFSRGPIVPIRLVANTGSLAANLVILTRK
jgi:ubiquinone/menaquinone biosynthesis C-methylase UbiE